MRTLGKYQVIEKIGVGGFGEVWKGYDPLIKRHVAIKTCETEDEEMRRRFFKEAEIAGNLHHRNITTVYDFGVEAELPYLIQEYLSGEDLDDKIKRRDYLPYPEKLYYLLQIARGLAHAHAQGVIHRDIKPANVRILEDGTAKIMDFGIAKLAQQESGLTQTGMTVGTAAYLAPEQIRGETIVRATDVFSFGVLAYELLTFQRPFQGDQISAVLYRTLHEEPVPIGDLWPDAPPAVTALIDRCLQKAPDRRVADGTALVRELETVQQAGAERRAVATAAPDLAAPTAPPAAAAPPAGLDESGFGLGPAARAAASADPLEASGAGFGPGAVARPPTATATTRHGLDELELTSYTPPPQRAAPASFEAPRPPRPPTAPVPTAGRKSLVLGAVLVAVALVAAAAGWWLGRDPRPATDPAGAVATDVTAPATAEVRAAPGPAADLAAGDGAAGAAAPATATASPRPVATPPSAVSDAADPPTGSGATAGESPVAAPPPPAATGYGELTVRAGLGKPQGVVWVDGERVGTTPLRGHRLRAGGHRLEIRPLAGDGAPIEQGLRVEPGREAVVTFDLGRQSAQVSQKRAGRGGEGP